MNGASSPPGTAAILAALGAEGDKGGQDGRGPGGPGWPLLIQAFESLAEAPDGIKRLRELVLQLAVRGKLVPQIEGEVPWAEGGAEGPFEVPAGWVWATVEQLGDLGPRNKVADSTEVGFVAMPAIPTDLQDPMTCERRSWAEVKKGYTHFAEGDVLVAKITPCFQNLKSCVAEGLPNGIGAGTTELYVVRPQLERVLPRYLLLYFKTPDFVAGGVATYSGTAGQQRVSSRYFAQAPVPIPPLAEQHRIVARVDALMSLLDRLETARGAREATRTALRDAALAALRDANTPEEVQAAWQPIAERMPDLFTDPADLAPLRQTVLQLAVRGRLVRQRSDDVADKHAVSEAKTPFAVPSEWTWRTVKECGEIKLGRQRSPKDHHGPNMVPYLRVANVQDGWLDLTDVKSMNFTPEEQETFRLLPDDILLNEGQSRELVGRSAIYRGEVPGACFQNTLLRFRPYPGLTPDFALRVFQSYLYEGRFSEAATQTTNMAHLSAGRLAAVEFPLPPEAEQHRIVAKVDELTTLIHRLEHHLTTAREAQTAFAAAAVHHLDG